MKALIAMSGGVDSSVAAALTKEQGIECIGCTMRLNEQGEDKDAAKIAEKLGIPFTVFDYRKEFRDCVIENFAAEYAAGRTPNPCVCCNKNFKFGKLMEEAEKRCCNFVVTGHYARIIEEDCAYKLLKARDPEKDQSYVLYNLSQSLLAHVRFPLGEYSKPEIRKMAEDRGFVNAHKSDSQDICFVPDGNYAKVLEDCGICSKPGNFVDSSGRVLGQHQGVTHYTIGQRKGLGIAFGEPMFVQRIDAARNEVVLGKNEELFLDECTVKEVNWVSGKIPEDPIRASVKIRYKAPEVSALITPLQGGRAAVRFDEPQRAITPGQSAVFYDCDSVIGGGVIE